MLDVFLFVGLPYMAMISLVVGSWLRYRIRPFSYSSLSTQFLENKWLAWASLPWHAGIICILLGHALAFGFPGIWSAFVSNPVFLLGVEALGIMAALLCLVSLLIFLLRRFVDARLQAVTNLWDVLVLVLLAFQVMTGLAVALHHPWGAAWAPGALGPYLQSLLLLQPEVAFVKEMPVFVKWHISLAWILVLLVPFTRLVHVFSVPLRYFIRSPQKVVWNSSRAQGRFEKTVQIDYERRLFLKAALGVGGSMFLLSLGTLDKFFRYFLKQDLSHAQEAHLLSKKWQRLKQSAQERELELERIQKERIFVAKLADLSRTRGTYFIDYEMRPALAFKDEQGFPIILSAKCTHLGCTVGQDVDAQGRILCPCHISYFDIKTGEPNAGAPAKSPLPHLGWALTDAQGRDLLVQDPDGRREGTVSLTQMENSLVFILKRFSG